MGKPIPLDLLEKYVNGSCTEEEAALVIQWYQSFEQADNHVPGMGAAEETELREQIYTRILSRVAIEAEDKETDGPKGALRKWFAIISVAATVVIAIGLTLLFFRSQNKNAQLAAVCAQPIIEVTNNTNQIYKAILSDKSSVWLSPHAQLKYPKGFEGRTREVTMSGECFFEVTKNPQRPFIIQSRSMVTKVWGTSFRVRDAAESNIAEVRVVTGKVSVRVKRPGQNILPVLKLEKDEVMLYPSQKVTYVLKQHVLKPELHPAFDSDIQHWNRLNLSFDNKPLSDIIPVLNARYHVHIVTGREQLNRYILNADMSGFNLADVLEALKKSLNINYQIKGNVIELE